MKTKSTPKLFVFLLSFLMLIASSFGIMTVTANAAESDYTAPSAGEAKIYGAVVNLGGDIEMKYIVELGEGVNADNVTLKTEFLGVVKELKSSGTYEETNYQVFKLEGITPQCMGDLIDAELYVDTTKTDEMLDYSVKENLVNLYNKTDTTEDAKRLIVDTLEYGAAAQTYANYKTDALVTADFDAASTDVDVEIPNNQPVLDDKSDAVSISTNVRYSSINYLLFGLTGADSFDGKVTIDTEAATGTMIDSYYAVSTSAISPENFHIDFNLRYDNGDNDYLTLAYSVNDYCYAAYKNGETDAMKQLALALYNYGLSAHIYKGTNHEGGTATCTDGKYCDICGVEYDTAVDSTNHNWENGVCTYGCGTEHDHTSWSDSGVCNDCGKAATLAVGTVSGEDFTTEQYYTDLQTAVDNANGKTIKLLANVDLSTTLTIAKDSSVTIDLNGNTIEDAENFTAIEYYYDLDTLIYVNGTITITDLSEDENGSVKTSDENRHVFYVNYTGTLTVQRGIISVAEESTNKYAIGAVFSSDSSPKVIITDGTFTGLVKVNLGCMSISGGNFECLELFKDFDPSYTMDNLTGGTFEKIVIQSSGISTSGFGLANDHYYYDANDNLITPTTKNLTNVTIKKGADLSKSATVTLDTASVSYNGSEQKPTITAVTVGGKTLAADKYTVSYTRDGATTTDFTSAGVITVTVTGTGDYSGSAKATYTISAAAPTMQWASTSETLNYSGSAAAITTPSITLVNSEQFSGVINYSYTGKDTTDADVSGEGLPTDAGTYTITATIAAQGNYAGAEATLDLTISKVDPTCTTTPAVVENLEYNGSNQALVSEGVAIGGTIEYKLGADGTYTTAVPTASEQGTYTVYWKIVGDKNHNDTAEQSISVTISAKAVTEDEVIISGYEASYTYTGTAFKPTITVTLDGKTLTEGKDFDVEYGENTYVGDGTIKITFNNNYSGTITKTFKIETVANTQSFVGDWMLTQ